MTLLTASCNFSKHGFFISIMASNAAKGQSSISLSHEILDRHKEWSRCGSFSSSNSNDSAIFCNNRLDSSFALEKRKEGRGIKRNRNSSGSSASSSLSYFSDKDNKKVTIETVDKTDDLERLANIGTSTIELQHETHVSDGCSNSVQPFKHHNLRNKIRRPACNCGCSAQSSTTTRLVLTRVQDIGRKTVTKETVISRTKIIKNDATQELHKVTFEKTYSPNKSDSNRKRRSEMEKLYDSLHEIEWAKNFSPDNILRQMHKRQAVSCSMFGSSPVKNPKRRKGEQDGKRNLSEEFSESRTPKGTTSETFNRSTRSSSLQNRSIKMCDRNGQSSSEGFKYRKCNSQRNDSSATIAKEQNNRRNKNSGELNLIKSSVECFELKENVGKLNISKHINVQNSAMDCKLISNSTELPCKSTLIKSNFELPNSITTLIPRYYGGPEIDNMELTSEYSLPPTFFDIAGEGIRTIDACFREVGAEVVISTCYETDSDLPLLTSVKDSNASDKVSCLDDSPPVLEPCMSYQVVKPDHLEPCMSDQVVKPDDPEPCMSYQVVKPDDPEPCMLYQVVKPDDPEHCLLYQDVKPDDPDSCMSYQVVKPDDPEPCMLYQLIKPDDQEPCMSYQVVKPDDPEPCMLYQLIKAEDSNSSNSSCQLQNDCLVPFEGLFAKAFGEATFLNNIPEIEFGFTGTFEESEQEGSSDSENKSFLDVVKSEEHDKVNHAEKEPENNECLEVLQRVNDKQQYKNNSLLKEAGKRILNKYLRILRTKGCNEVAAKQFYVSTKDFASPVKKKNASLYESSREAVEQHSTIETENCESRTVVTTTNRKLFLCQSPEKITLNHSKSSSCTYSQHNQESSCSITTKNVTKKSLTVEDRNSNFFRLQHMSSPVKKEYEALPPSAPQPEGKGPKPKTSNLFYFYDTITVNRSSGYTQVILKLTHFTVESLRELKEIVGSTAQEASCHALILNGIAESFSLGLDLRPLLGTHKTKAATNIAHAVKEFIEALSSFKKPLVAVVNGAAYGLGMTVLNHADTILASEKATFCMPQTRMGYFPEGGATLTLPRAVGSTVAMDLIVRGRVLTAQEALQIRLVTEVFEEKNLPKDLISIVKVLSKNSLESMETTKAMMKMHLQAELLSVLENEVKLLPQMWLSDSCQKALAKEVAAQSSTN